MDEPESSRPRFRRHAVVTLAVVTGFAIFLGAAFYERSRLGWRGAYFALPELAGEPVFRRDPSIAFRWYDESPMPEIPREDFSVRWETCLVVEEERPLEVYIGSDDGIRMNIDGELFIDRFFPRSYKTDHMPVELAPGHHHVVVEYFNAKSEAHALARFQEPGFSPKPLPLERYRLPSDDPRAERPCDP